MSWMRTPTQDPAAEETDYNRDMQSPAAKQTPATAPMRAAAGSATIGRSIRIEGTVSGKEDLTIDGTVKGKINLNGHALIVGSNGNIEADVNAKHVTVQGQVKGNIRADDKVQVTATGTVQGDLQAPRIALDDGASFTGSVDTGSKPAAQPQEAKKQEPQVQHAQHAQHGPGQH